MTATPPVDRATASRLTRNSGGAGGCNPPAILAVWIARRPVVQLRYRCREVKRDGTSRARRLLGQAAAAGGTTQPARLAACLDRA
jgi:hypothetical protein